MRVFSYSNTTSQLSSLNPQLILIFSSFGHASPENLRQSVDGINAKLRDTKRLDHFECARVDEKYEIEDQMKTLAGFVAEGKFDHIGLSEVTAEQIRRANKVAFPLSARYDTRFELSYISSLLDCASILRGGRSQSMGLSSED